MRRQLILMILLVLSASDQVLAYDLSEHEWRHRLLFLIAPSVDNQELAAQQQYLDRRRDAFLDRDILVFQLFPNQGSLSGAELSPVEVRNLRERLGVAAEDRLVILIGKDGGIKRRAELDTDLREIFRLIDAMPMRREEMRTKI